jgi:protein arginine kinase
MSVPLLLTSFDRTAKWMRRGGRENDIVLSSRIRLARNLRRYEFPHRAPAADLLVVRQRAWKALHATGFQSGGLPDARLLAFEEFNNWEKQSLIDRHVTSREHTAEELGRGVAASADASLCVLVNEEDHIRIQSLLPGLQLDVAHHLVDKLDDVLEDYFDQRGGFAYSEAFGYLTACPTNAGTGMRASVMLHLPALEITGKIERARKWADDKHLTLRGTFGEGSKIWGHLHQLSNQTTMGVDETQILLDTQNAAQELCDMERRARAALETDKWREEVRDGIGRAFGVLRYARRIGCREATDCLSLLRLGHELNWAKGLTRQRFNELMVWIRPAYMQVLHSRTIASAERDVLRAELLRPHIARVKLESVFTAIEAISSKPKEVASTRTGAERGAKKPSGDANSGTENAA